ncbi:mobile element protein [Microcystis sp. 0824]|nr:mobile element protein [Microcystis sp. 0824]
MYLSRLKNAIYGAVDAVTFEGFIVKEVLPKIKEGDCLIMDK